MSVTQEVLSEAADVLEVQKIKCDKCGDQIKRTVMQVAGISGLEDGDVLAQVECEPCDHNSLERVTVADVLPHAAQRFVLKLNDKSDWETRRVFKSRSTFISIPEIGLESASTSVAGGTVLELLEAVREEMMNVPAFQAVDQTEGMLRMMDFIESFSDVVNGFKEATLEIEDAKKSLCYVEARGENDEHLTVTR
eukprot:TRINITY_DN6677_c0_g1_i1.p1 TRINITY_DN6677_c0_g1~~TRINITY_DN6677_c0_g1_i1.p1  ORF type:complete len:194 (+),score=48.79 TRINITY_DN6677_c0_g1_i1:235-816(+)